MEKNEKRPLGIPTMTDRAMQGLQLLALAPIAETTADKVSFGFRQNQMCTRCNGIYVQTPVRKNFSGMDFWEGDIKGCFDNISHDWMLENIPSDKRIMRQFLRCGYVENKRLFPTTEGSPQGGLISPTYANMNIWMDLKDYYLKDTVRAVQGTITRITTSIKYTYAATLMISL